MRLRHKFQKSFSFTLHFLFCLLPICVFVSCAKLSAISLAGRAYGEDSNYFLGLRALSENKPAEARKLFLRASERASHFISLRSMERLARLGNIQERVSSAKKLVAKFPKEESALLIALEELFDANEYAEIIRITNDIDFATCDNGLARIRLLAMYEKKDSRFWQSIYSWFSERTMSAQHSLLYGEMQPLEESAPSLAHHLMEFRVAVFMRDYTNAYDMAKKLHDEFHENNTNIPHYVIADMGRAFLYSKNSSVQDINFFASIAKNSANRNLASATAMTSASSPATARELASHLAAFYAYFYAARLAENARNLRTAQTYYQEAMSAALALRDGKRYDNALWYFLKSIPITALDEIISAVKTYCTTWHDASYYDDFFSSLAVTLLAEGNFSDFKNLADVLDGYASPEIVAQYAYIYARLLETHAVSSSLGIGGNGIEQEKYFEMAFDRSRSYYAFLSGKKMGLSDAEIFAHVASPPELVQTSFGAASTEPLSNGSTQPTDKAGIEKLLKGYAEFGLPEYIYGEWRKFYDAGIRLSMETDTLLAQFLWHCGESDYKYYPESLRIASLAFRNRESQASKDLLKLVYPKDYEVLVNNACENFSVSPDLMFALIRSESFFDAGIKSSAGAMGLTQLMDFTASDIATRLRRKEYDVKNPDDSITFGTYYLGNLISRLDDSPIAALFAYNAGITKVRRWMNGAATELRHNISDRYDLFLETLPYEETRGYGRQVVSAAVFYGILYYDKTVEAAVTAVMR